jgi:hypothetical protein
MRVRFVQHLTLIVGDEIVERVRAGESRDVEPHAGIFLTKVGWAHRDSRVCGRRRQQTLRPIPDRRSGDDRRDSSLFGTPVSDTVFQ